MLKSALKITLTIVIALNFDANIFAQGLVPQKDEKKNLWGYVNSSTGKWVVKPKYESASDFKTQPNGKSRAVVAAKGLTGFMDEGGKLLGAGVAFEKMQPLEGDAMLVTVKGKTGVANYDGIYLIKPEAETVEKLGDEGWIVTLKDKKGILRNDGSYLMKPLYKDIDTSIPGYFIVYAGDKPGLMKRDGTQLIAPKAYSSIAPFKDNIWKIGKGKKVGLMDVTQGAIILEPKYENVIGSYLGNMYFIVRQGKNIDIINAIGNRLMRYTGYDDIVVNEDTPQRKLLITLNGNTYYIFNESDAKAYKLDVKNESCYDFSRRVVTLADGQKNNDISAYLSKTRYFVNNKGETTPYVRGIDLNGKVYAMMDGDNAYLFKEGTAEPLGKLSNIKSGDRIKPADHYELVSGEVVDKYGKKIKIVKYKDKVVAMQNSATGRYELTGKPGEGYDIIKINTRLRRYNDYYAILAARDGKLYLLNESGSVVEESEKDGLLEIDFAKTGAFPLIVDKDCNFGLKDPNGNILLTPGYDDIYMLILYNQDGNFYGNTTASSLFKLYKDGKCALYDAAKKKILVPFEKNYASIGGMDPEDMLHDRLYDSGLCYVRVGEKGNNEKDTAYGLYNFNLGKEIVAPQKDCKITKLPKGYKGYEIDGVAYAPDGNKLSLPAAIDVYQVEWGNHMPNFFFKAAGLEGKTVKLYVTTYDRNGNIYRDASGNKCIYEYQVTPTQAVEYGPRIAVYGVQDDVHLRPYSSITLKYVLTAKDAKTGAPIPVKGESSITQTWQRNR